ncbi:hypothetical protein CC2G_011417 [Coprinopsis cinerea AmutBmut pab1-1]|nr:hypothetical protein CC2G_011417 [Coprinopsis cinerea AmutBmut pab1-1]
MTLKTFALGALVAYSGLALSAFVYVPFGEGVMHLVQRLLFDPSKAGSASGLAAMISSVLNGTTSGLEVSEKDTAAGGTHLGLWDMDTMNARNKLNPARLRDQMFAFTVTNQIINTFTEVGLPFVLRGVNTFLKKGKPTNGNGDSLKKKVVFEDEKERGGLEERAYLERIRSEAALPEYDLFADYNEMVVQFGYVALWSTIWPLAGAMAFINNIFELRSDAFKITVHHRRPMPVRTDTIGPWLDALTFLTWLSALTNSALLYLFSPSLLSTPFQTLVNVTNTDAPASDAKLTAEEHLVAAAGGTGSPNAWGVDASASPSNVGATKELLLKAALVALVASHVYIIVKALIRHVVEKIWWKGSSEVAEKEREEVELKQKFLSGVGVQVDGGEDGVPVVGSAVKKERDVKVANTPLGDPEGFWDHDEGVDEIQRIVKEA